ncbi:MAG: hypothetical protein RMJ17_03680 [Candidatus Aenigmarchaeota archaeon]|nr:hypothetical protein [Candidatus Aenigmarchaeota archaeon]MDW8149663.1 hypothetical protein [Candidatus Aenigmarchaeota archaeon]
MNKKIPKIEKVKEAIRRVIYSRLRVESLEELCNLVLRELKREDVNYRISPNRIKKVVLQMKEIKIEAKTKRLKNIEKIEKCPICKSNLIEIKTKNLLKKDIVIGYKCEKCGYKSDLKSFTPMEYIFSINFSNKS